MSKNVLLGVSGGISAYKALDIVSRLKKAGVTIDVIMTENATKLVTPLSFRTLSQNNVVTDTFETPNSWDVGHIALAQKADLVLIAPATANIIGKIAGGIADDMLTTTVMATKAPVVLAPAMNVNMYENPLVQANIIKLAGLGYDFIQPEEGILACGDVGKGRLADPEMIVGYVLDKLKSTIEISSSEKEGPKSAGWKKLRVTDYKNKNILVTAGPTVEEIDPVRYISNRSSGKMGFSIAEAALARGANVTLVAGPVKLSCSEEIRRIDVKTAEDMRQAVNDIFDDIDIVIMAAAPADYRVEHPYDEKIKKTEDRMSISLVKNTDILAELGKRKNNQLLVGFAAETQNLVAYAKEKIKKKNLDMIVANNVSLPGAGFDKDTNIITIITAADGSIVELEQMTKREAADIILDTIKTI